MTSAKPAFLDIIIPTLNSGRVIDRCLNSIISQKFKNYRIIIADAGSTDKTISKIKKLKLPIFIVPNPLKTGEAGKAAGLKYVSAKYVAFIDSDNILPDAGWLDRMLKPLNDDRTLIGSEPIRFSYRPHSGFIERYSALIGANDPYAFITGIYDRQNFLNHKWTGLKIKNTDFTSYIKIQLLPHHTIPTIGANGTIFRTDFLKKHFSGSYLFDIDLITRALNLSGEPLYFAKVKTGIIHTFCESSVTKFIRKQNRRLVDYYTFREIRTYDWSAVNRQSALKFTLYSLFIFPAIFDSIRGFFHKPDIAWFFHPVACLLTLYIYALNSLKNKFGLIKPINRLQWQQ